MTIKYWHLILVIGLSLLLAGTSGLAIFFWNKTVDQTALLGATQTELQAARLEVGRGKTTLADANKYVSQLTRAIQEEIKSRQAVITLYAELEAKYQAEKKKVKTLNTITYRDRFREIEIPAGRLFHKTEEGKYLQVDSLKYNYQDHRIDITGDAIKQTISYQLHQKFRAQLVESQGPGGMTNHYASLWEVNQEGKDMGKLELTRFEVVKSETLAEHFMWWNPKLDLLGGLGVSFELEPAVHLDLGISAMSWGKTADDISWRFVRVGAAVTGDDFAITLSPFQYNIGKVLPLISNLWVTPFIGYSITDNTGVFGLGLSVVL